MESFFAKDDADDLCLDLKRSSIGSFFAKTNHSLPWRSWRRARCRRRKNMSREGHCRPSFWWFGTVQRRRCCTIHEWNTRAVTPQPMAPTFVLHCLVMRFADDQTYSHLAPPVPARTAENSSGLLSTAK